MVYYSGHKIIFGLFLLWCLAEAASSLWRLSWAIWQQSKTILWPKRKTIHLEFDSDVCVVIGSAFYWTVFLCQKMCLCFFDNAFFYNFITFTFSSAPACVQSTFARLLYNTPGLHSYIFARKTVIQSPSLICSSPIVTQMVLLVTDGIWLRPELCINMPVRFSVVLAVSSILTFFASETNREKNLLL